MNHDAYVRWKQPLPPATNDWRAPPPPRRKGIKGAWSALVARWRRTDAG